MEDQTRINRNKQSTKHRSLPGTASTSMFDTVRKSFSRAKLDRAILQILSTLDTPRALTVWLLYSAGEHDQLLQLTCDPLSSAFSREAYLATKLLSKSEFLVTSVDREGVALEKAHQAEAQCRDTNLRLVSPATWSNYLPASSDLINRAARKIAWVLGLRPTFPDRGWSPGRTSCRSGFDISAPDKYTGQLDCTPAAADFALREVNRSALWLQAVERTEHLSHKDLNFVQHNTLICVPKNAKTHRTICYEPHLNIWCQLKVGSYIRDRLLRLAGVDLSDQSVNRRRARFAARHGSLATIDLASASDTISKELVRLLLPYDWYRLLDSLRSKNTLWPDGQVRVNEKFSSMGNGFTFELESLIFWAITTSVCEHEGVNPDVTVYGDDIIAPVEITGELVRALSFFGFTTNKEKSFSEGLFRESCGAEYFASTDVTPFYIRRSGWYEFILLHNQFRKWSSLDGTIDRGVVSVLRRIRNDVPAPCGPKSDQHGYYHVNFDETHSATPMSAHADMNRKKRHSSYEGWLHPVLVALPVKRAHRPECLTTAFSKEIRSTRSKSSLEAAILCASTGPRSSLDISGVFDSKILRWTSVRKLTPSWDELVVV